MAPRASLHRAERRAVAALSHNWNLSAAAAHHPRHGTQTPQGSRAAAYAFGDEGATVQGKH